MNIYTLRQNYRRQNAWGLLASIDLKFCNHNLTQSPKDIRKFVDEICRRIKMKKYGPLYLKKFGESSLEGYSAIQFIKTSSITVHFDDKISDRAFIDIFSCEFFDPFKAKEFSQKYFRAKSARMKILIRR
ncbi:MAG: S-adenosylmethionine decarboxylase [Candidatus Portnoybacteria bacterium CG_4_10_14_0_2_um_filter_43_36]|uniref:S-adenosylmethionine decarboxylase n=3 Tax=Candidatus Portnoyibacteriota TaxID=1817913 RepID=A0A2M7YM06_9BACT|nr:MAG: S-adenosylmethionine decarboxylase [Candidatus Portnoybacteria bacterium CG23_combo_of_CG06-09_8_20_14_all_44_36]PIZ69244.1 MAG: S-adenosylmethionine decarboxylase [Candidatus Portnoybacteria bacterium CG_4_10_14_0_2_um_filter_43_36]PJA63976.1 MAG: S-adenosylmethionine decarboxylase [Candidatus Portnoybacteria bacterium CG_4_9_14_3_um_filter_43_11]PJE59169.1 MAG: S-adenosylmethionine decarboxylase [Candidatus Portnoybacteria bacterium CG10_big_fil_rev_8_21_14_0_10_43_39]